VFLHRPRQAAVRGRLPVRRSASKLEPDELANEQAIEWLFWESIFHQLIFFYIWDIMGHGILWGI